ncbi:hypothetical protein [Pseudalkalibacillus sp. SCS-8]|uniref:hypothetical protein n=1 Tax=Pseudalkalibacillus nanhaiensis TaxID=3115291 RepID=UPI0032DAE181
MFNSGLRGFGAGLIVAAGILAIVHYQGSGAEDTQAKAEGSETITYEEVKSFLDSEGLVAITQAELDQMKEGKAGKDSDDKKSGKTEEDTEEESAEKEEVIKTTLVISKGTSTGEVTSFLEKQKIIDDGDDLLDYIQDHNLETKVRFGEYDVNSKMTIAQIAKIITSP